MVNLSIIPQLFALASFTSYFDALFPELQTRPVLGNSLLSPFHRVIYHRAPQPGVLLGIETLPGGDPQHVPSEPDHGLVHISSDGSLRVTCTSPSSNGPAAVGSLVEAINNQLNNPEMLYSITRALPAHASCVVEDVHRHALWLFADEVGQIPLWYSFSISDDVPKGERLLVTTDYLLGLYLGVYFPELNAAGPGQIIRISMETYEIDFVEQWNHFSARPSIKVVSHEFQMQAQDLYALSIEALSKSLGSYRTDNMTRNHFYQYLVEADPLDTSSSYQQCLLDSLTVSTFIYRSKPLVGMGNVYKDPQLERIVGLLVLKEQDQIRTGSLVDIAVERWEFCKVAKYNNLSVLSFDTGLKFRPVKVFFQNLFCDLLGVAVIYPYSDLKLQSYMQSIDFTSSAVSLIVDNWSAFGVCNIQGLTVRSIAFTKSGNPFTASDESVEYDTILSRANITRTMTIKSTTSETIVHSNNGHLKSRIGTLWKSANGHASEEGYIFVLMATSGYREMLENFLCSALAVGVGSSHLLVITPNDDIADLAASAGVGYFLTTDSYRPDKFTEKVCLDDQGEIYACTDNQQLNSVSFGTLHYQELMLYRTRVVLDLLILGFQPIIADIDTVWKEDPLGVLRNSTIGILNDDIAVTNDHGEICGCFVALRNTPNAIKFWSTVTFNHRNLVERARLNNSLSSFSDSEQKILTALIKDRRYKGSLNVRLLPGRLFPAGVEYFNLATPEYQSPSIIHNNFIIGMDMKKTRFLRNGLWNIKPSYDTGKSISANKSAGNECTVINKDQRLPDNVGMNATSRGIICQYDYLALWARIFHRIDKNIQIPSITSVLPAHNSIMPKGVGRLLTQVSTERLPRMATSAIPVIKDMMLQVQVDPPAGTEFAVLGIYDLQIGDETAGNTMTTGIINSNVAVTIDVGAAGSSVLGCDFGGHHTERAQNTVLEYKHKSILNPDYHSDKMHLECALNSSAHTMDYTIKIIAFNRPLSLQRLLQSLLLVDYCRFTVPLDIIIDGVSKEKDAVLVRNTLAIAEAFRWPHGKLTVYRRDVNIGLAAQWLRAFDPISVNEAAFIFEDDNEVSPYFFKWAITAVDKYYLKNPRQLFMQTKLLETVRKDIQRLNGIISSEHFDHDLVTDYRQSHLYNFSQTFAGEPLMYGVCLQKQHVDPAHYPKNLEIRNAHRPFLYSLVGSWGPLVLPWAWKAFREWWSWRHQHVNLIPKLHPTIFRLVTNHFYRENNQIWTPWMARFAFETGAKCLYSNLPDQLALVTNYRDAGVNYPRSLGKSSTLLSREHFDGLFSELDDEFSSSPISKALQDALIRSFSDFPSIESLAQWQYDFHVRRSGSMHVDRTLAQPFMVKQKTELGENLTAWQDEVNLYDVANHFNMYAEKLFTNLNGEHWAHVIGMIEAHIHPLATVLYTDVSPAMLLLAANGYQNHRLLSMHGDATCNRQSRQMTSVLESNHLPRIARDIIKRLMLNDTGSVDNLCFHPRQTRLSTRSPSITIMDIFILDGFNGHNDVFPVTEYLLVMGPCASAPTDLSMLFDEYHNYLILKGGDNQPATANKTVDYTMIEDVCIEGKHDVGGVLYQRVDLLDPLWSSRRHAVSRRIEGSLMSTRIISRKYQPAFI